MGNVITFLAELPLAMLANLRYTVRVGNWHARHLLVYIMIEPTGLDA